jgi:hypothetical protein
VAYVTYSPLSRTVLRPINKKGADPKADPLFHKLPDWLLQLAVTVDRDLQVGELIGKAE